MTVNRPAGQNLFSRFTHTADAVVRKANANPREAASSKQPQKIEKNTTLKAYSPRELDLRGKQILMGLQSRDREVRNHEHAHLAAAGGLATGKAHLVYVTGPDGRRYAVGGEVSIDTTAEPGNPERTIAKAQIIRRAALAPPNPSPQDRRVAAAATRMEQVARAELMQQKIAERTADNPAQAAADLQPEEPASMANENRETENTAANITFLQAGQFYATGSLHTDDYSQVIDVFA